MQSLAARFEGVCSDRVRMTAVSHRDPIGDHTTVS